MFRSSEQLLHLSNRFPVCLWLCLAATIIWTGCSRPDQEALSSFAATYVAHHETGNVDGLLELILIPDSTSETDSFIRFALLEEVQWPLKDLQAERLDKSERIRMTDRFPLDPLWRIYVILDTEDRYTSAWIAGMRDGEVFLMVEKSPPGEDRSNPNG